MTDRRLGQYIVESKIGEGGMGEVYRAKDSHLDRVVAIKILRADAVARPERQRRFIQEAKAASALNHPNIVTIYDINQSGGCEYIAMEYVDGRSLESLIRHKTPSLPDALRIAIQIADGLGRAHEAGITHRDLKPANIMVRPDNRVKILDFGLAKLNESASDGGEVTQTADGVIVGTAAYMSPEQAQGMTVDARSDIFSFGAVLYEMITGEHAFPGASRLSVLNAVLASEPRPLRDRNPEIPAELDRIVRRCLRKDPERRFQQISEVKLALEELKEDSSSSQGPAAAAAPRKRNRRMWIAAGGVCALALAGGLLWYFTRSSGAPRAAAELTRVTLDTGLTTEPALSPDGKLVAYASDRRGDNLDLWLQRIGSGEPLRLTDHPADDREPSFSPDGSQIVFTSTRDGGGIYVAPVLGGEARRIARGGREPRYSPDGRELAYWIGATGAALGQTRQESYVVAAAGGEPRRIAADLRFAHSPAWSPDGRHLAVTAGAPFDVTVVPAGGGAAVRTGTAELLQKHGFTGGWALAAWTERGLLLSARKGSAVHVWRIPLANDFTAAGEPERLTFGAGREINPSVAPGLMAFSSGNFHSDIWSLPVDANRGEATGPMTRITDDASVKTFPRVSDDGTHLVFHSQHSGKGSLRLKDLSTGKESALTDSLEVTSWPAISGDGRLVTYSQCKTGSCVQYGIRLPGSASEPLCQDCSVSNWDLSNDGNTAIVQANNERPVIVVFDVRSRKRRSLLRHPEYDLLSPRLSQDERWMAMHVRLGEMTRRIYILPFRPDNPAQEPEWIPVTDGKALDRDPAWSPDGKILYFVTDRDGFRCIAAQRLDPATKRPVGSMFIAKHLHSPRLSMLPIQNTAAAAPVTAPGRLIFVLGESTSNIWLTKLPQ